MLNSSDYPQDFMSETSTARYKPICCYECGNPFLTYQFSDTWKMRIDNVLHDVPVYAVPCMYCKECNISVTDGGSDEAIQWAYRKYINEHGLNTPYLRGRRWLRRWFSRLQYWHWNRAPWARWTWPKDECPDRVKNRRWWQWL